MKFSKELLIPFGIALLSLIFSLVILPGISLNLFQNPRIAELGFLEAWSIWDAPHYLDIADSWYQTSGDDAYWIVFLPLYPILVGAVGFLPLLGILESGFLVSIVCALAAAVVFYKLLRLDENKDVSIFTVLILFVFPTSFFLFLPYPESLFLLLILLTFHNLRRGNFLLGSLLAMLATATKIAGLALIPVIFVELILYHIQSRKQVKFLEAFLILNLPILGFLFYLFINYSTFGDIFYFQKAQSINWNTGFYPVVPGFKQAVSFTSDPEFESALYLGFGQIVAFSLTIITVIYSYFKMRKSYFIFSLAFLLIYGSMSFWLSLPRYLLTLFPLYIMIGRLAQNKVFLGLWVFLSILLLFVLGTIALEHGSVL